MKKWVLLPMLALLVLGAQAQERAEWTMIHYMALDNNLEGEGFGDLREMSYAGSDSNVNIVVQYDRAAGYFDGMDDWTSTRRFYVQRAEPEYFSVKDIAEYLAPLLNDGSTSDADLEAQIIDLSTSDPATYDALLSYYGISAEVPFTQEAIEDIGEADMGDPQVFEEFVSWSIENFPANHYMIVISDHGGGWHAIGPDEDNDNSMLELPEIDLALANLREKYGIDKFDIVGFDACLMSQLEVATMLEPHANYMLASQEVIPGAGWEYDKSLNALRDNPDMDALELGTVIVDEYMDHYAGVGNRTKVDLALIDLAQIDPLIVSLGKFADASDGDMVSFLSAFGTARNNAQPFGASASDRGEYFSSVDLQDFMRFVSIQTSISEDLFLASQEVLAATESAVAYARADEKLPGSNGLAIYLPLTGDIYAYADGGNITYADAIPPKMGAWDRFLKTFHETATTTLAGQNLSIAVETFFTASGSASIEDQPTVLFTADGQGIVDLSYFVFYNDQDLGTIMVDAAALAFFTELPTGETVVEYPNGKTESLYSWGAEVPILSDGSTSSLAVVFTDNSASNESTIEGTLTTADGDLSANLIFDLGTRQLQSIVAFDDDGSGYAAPFEVSPEPGWQFTPFWYVFDDNGDLTSVSSGNVFTFGESPLSYTYAPAPTGNYEMRLRMNDLAGNSAFDRVSFDVDNNGVSGEFRGYTNVNDGVSFVFPYTWYDPTTLENGDGSQTERLSERDPDRNNNIYVDVYEADSADEMAQILVDKMSVFADMSLSDPRAITPGGAEGYAWTYEYTAEDGVHDGVVFALYSDLAQEGYIIDVDYNAQFADELAVVAQAVEDSLIFYTPLTFSDSQ